MDINKYQIKLWQTRSKLQAKGVHKPINEMVKLGLIKKDTKYSNLILGRVKDITFLNQLVNFNNSIE